MDGWGKRRAAQLLQYIESRPHATVVSSRAGARNPTPAAAAAATVLFSFFDRDNNLAGDTSALRRVLGKRTYPLASKRLGPRVLTLG